MFEKVNPMHPEVWKDVEDFEGHYQVSNHGRVRSIKKEILVLKGEYQHNGYKRVCLWKDGRKHNKLVHRLVAIAFLQNPSNYSDVNHIDEDKNNNHVTNLQWCTHLYNMNFGSVREKISYSNRGKIASTETRKKLSNHSKDCQWISNGTCEKFIKKDLTESYLSDGWFVGRLKRKTK